jgi:hypothetical protein
MAVLSAVFLFKRFQNVKSDPKFDRRGVMLLIKMPERKRFWNIVLVCVLLRKNFQNSVLVHSITKIPLVVLQKFKF